MGQATALPEFRPPPPVFWPTGPGRRVGGEGCTPRGRAATTGAEQGGATARQPEQRDDVSLFTLFQNKSRFRWQDARAEQRCRDMRAPSGSLNSRALFKVGGPTTSGPGRERRVGRQSRTQPCRRVAYLPVVSLPALFQYILFFFPLFAGSDWEPVCACARL